MFKKFSVILSLIFMMSFQMVFALSNTWDLNTAGEYTVSDATKVEVADGVGKLKGTPGNYPTDVGITITPNVALSFTTSLASFTETLGANNVEGVRDYLVSSDNGATWKCFDHGMWEDEMVCTGGSSATTINDNISTLDTDGGQFLWKATLKSWPPLGYSGPTINNGENQVELDQIDVTYDVPVNTAPVITFDGGGDTAAVSINENTTTVTTVTATDDVTQTLTYSITGNGPEDIFFDINQNTGVLTFKSAPDFEDPQDKPINQNGVNNGTNTYVVEVKVEDDQTPKLSDIQFITVTVLDVVNEAPNVAPTDITIDSDNINENNAINDIVGNLTTIDSDSSSFEYTLVDNANYPDNASFGIDNSRLIAKTVFDFEVKNSYTIKIKTDDKNGGTFEEEFIIRINNVSEHKHSSRKHKKTCRDLIAVNYSDYGVHDASKCVYQLGDELEDRGEVIEKEVKEVIKNPALFRQSTFNVAENSLNVATLDEEVNKTKIIETGTMFDNIEVANPDWLPSIKAYDIDQLEMNLENLQYEILPRNGDAFDGDKFEIKDRKLVFKTAPDFENPENFFRIGSPNKYKVAIKLSNNSFESVQVITVNVTDKDDTCEPFKNDILTVGNHDDARALQHFLNTYNHGKYKVAETGYGSLDQETPYFGRMTQQALRKFQLHFKSQIFGNASLDFFGEGSENIEDLDMNHINNLPIIFDAKTRAKVNQLVCIDRQEEPEEEIVGACREIPESERYFKGETRWNQTSSEVKKLQHFLNTHGYPVAQSGAGSLGHETNYYGNATVRALGNFQSTIKARASWRHSLGSPFTGLAMEKAEQILCKERQTEDFVEAGIANADQSTFTIENIENHDIYAPYAKITVYVRDKDGNVLRRGGDNVEILVSDAKMSEVEDLGDGRYVARVVANKLSYKNSVRVKINGKYIILDRTAFEEPVRINAMDVDNVQENNFVTDNRKIKNLLINSRESRAVGDRLYILKNNEFSIVDISDESHPNVLGKMVQNNGRYDGIEAYIKDARHFDLSGHFAFISTMWGLTVLDIGDESNIKVIGRIKDFNIKGGDVEIIGNFAYILSDSDSVNKIMIVDISDLHNLRLIDTRNIDLGRHLFSSASIHSYNTGIAIKFDNSEKALYLNLSRTKYTNFPKITDIDLDKSSISTTKNYVSADGIDNSIITLELKDKNERIIPVNDDIVNILVTGDVDTTNVINNGDGIYKTVISNNKDAVAKVTATVNGLPVTSIENEVTVSIFSNLEEGEKIIDMTVNKQNAYLLTNQGSKYFILNIKLDDNPALVSRTKINLGEAFSYSNPKVKIDKNYLFVAGFKNGVGIYKITNTGIILKNTIQAWQDKSVSWNKPIINDCFGEINDGYGVRCGIKLIGTKKVYRNIGYINDIKIINNRNMVLVGSDGVDYYNISRPENPKHLDSKYVKLENIYTEDDYGKKYSYKEYSEIIKRVKYRNGKIFLDIAKDSDYVDSYDDYHKYTTYKLKKDNLELISIKEVIADIDNDTETKFDKIKEKMEGSGNYSYDREGLYETIKDEVVVVNFIKDLDLSAVDYRKSSYNIDKKEVIANGVDKAQITIELKNIAGDFLLENHNIKIESDNSVVISEIANKGNGTYIANIFRDSMKHLKDSKKLRITVDGKLLTEDTIHFIKTARILDLSKTVASVKYRDLGHIINPDAGPVGTNPITSIIIDLKNSLDEDYLTGDISPSDIEVSATGQARLTTVDRYRKINRYIVKIRDIEEEEVDISVKIKGVNVVLNNGDGLKVRFSKFANRKLPVITLNQEGLQIIELGQEYEELGATAQDMVNNRDISSLIQIDTSDLNLAEAGDYEVVYSVTDENNNTATLSRDVRVVDGKVIYYNNERVWGIRSIKLNNGNVLNVWVTENRLIKARIVDTFGTPVSDAFMVTILSSGYKTDVSKINLLKLNNGNILITWHDGNSGNIYSKIISETGGEVKNKFKIAHTDSELGYMYDIYGAGYDVSDPYTYLLDNGNVLIVWRTEVDNFPYSFIAGKVIDRTGRTIRREHMMSTLSDMGVLKKLMKNRNALRPKIIPAKSAGYLVLLWAAVHPGTVNGENIVYKDLLPAFVDQDGSIAEGADSYIETEYEMPIGDTYILFANGADGQEYTSWNPIVDDLSIDLLNFNIRKRIDFDINNFNGRVDDENIKVVGLASENIVIAWRDIDGDLKVKYIDSEGQLIADINPFQGSYISGFDMQKVSETEILFTSYKNNIVTTKVVPLSNY